MMSLQAALVLAAGLALPLGIGALGGALALLRRLDRRRADRARRSPAYRRAGVTEVLDGSPVAELRK
jgi:hypothetical protein